MNILKFGDKKWFTVTILTAIITSLFGIFTAFITGKFISIAMKGTVNDLFKLIAFSFLSFVLFYVISMVYIYAKNQLLFTCNMSIKDRIFHGILYSTEEKSIKEYISLMTNDLKQFEVKGLTNELVIIQNGVTFIFALSFGLYLDIPTTLVFFLTSFSPVIISHLFSNKITQSADHWSTANAQYTGKITDYLSGVDTITNYNAQDAAKKDFHHSVFSLENALNKMNRMTGYSSETIGTAAYASVFLLSFSFGIYRVLTAKLDLGSFMSIVQVSNSLLNPLFLIMTAINERKTTKKIQEELKKVPENVQSSDEQRVHSFEISQGGIKLGEKFLFNHLDMRIDQGDKVLITAPSGYGKSTLLRAIGGFIPFESGNYRVNNQDSEELYLKNKFALIKQNPFIFDHSIEFNITMGNNYKEEDLIDAIEKSQLTEVVTEKGLAYQVGENGKNLSGGQLQRIEIARGLLSKRPIILADEITSALDPITSQKITDYFLNSSDTVIEVAHKVTPEQLAKYTKIIHLDQLEKKEQ